MFVGQPAAPGSQWLATASSYYSQQHKIDIRFCFRHQSGGGKKKVLKIKPALRGCLTASVWSLRRPALICRHVKITCDSLVAQFSSEMHFPFGPRAETFAQLRHDIPATCDSRRSRQRPVPATLTPADCAAARRWFAGCLAG